MAELWKNLIAQEDAALAEALTLSRVSISKKTGEMRVRLQCAKILNDAQFERTQRLISAAFPAVRVKVQLEYPALREAVQQDISIASGLMKSLVRHESPGCMPFIDWNGKGWSLKDGVLTVCVSSAEGAGFLKSRRVDRILAEKLSDLFGTVELSQPYPDACASLTVLPAERGAALPENFPQQLTGDAIRRRALMPDRFAVSGIREYADGDSARDVCWSASARSERLMVWQYQETAAPSLTVLLNCETRPTDRDQVSDRSAYEDAIRIAAAYLCAAARAGIPVRFCANTMLGDSPAETAFCAGDAGAMRMRRLLAALPLTVSGRFTQMLTRISAEDTAATLLIVTAYTDAEMLKRAAQDPRMTVLTLRAPAGDRIPQNVRQISLAAMKG